MSTPRKGFSLIEVLVAMTMLSVILLSIAKISIAIGVRARTNDVVAKRAAALQLEANKLGAVPFASLATWSTAAQTFNKGNFQYSRRLTITAAGASRYQIKIVVIPSADSARKDSIMFDRTLSPGSPLCKGC